MDKQEALNLIATEIGLPDDPAGLFPRLVEYINHLLSRDFQKLISILYRVDVSEPLLREVLKNNPASDAGELIANLIIDRQVRKIESRRKHSRRDNNISEDEKW